jgi:hypothetical protein
MPASTTPLTPFATLYPDTGTRIRFYFHRLPDGRIGSMAVLASSRYSYGGLGAVERLRGANPLEIYNALAPAGTPIPSALLAVYGQPQLGQRGWALPLDLLAEPLPEPKTCMAGSDPFEAVADDVMSWDFEHLFLSEDDGPTTKPHHWFDDNGPADGNIHRQLRGGAYAVHDLYMRTSLCFADTHEYPTPEHPHYASAWLRPAGGGAWQLVDTVGLFEPGDNFSFLLDDVVDGGAFDVRLTLTAAHLLDQYHIGATWE